MAIQTTIEVLRIPGTLFPRGPYDENADYKFLNIVESGGSGYVCLQPCTGIPVTNTAYWFKFVFRGEKGDAFTYADLTAEQKAELVRDATAAAQAAASSAQSAADDAAAALQKFNAIKAAIDALDPTSTEGSIQTLAAKQGLLEADLNALGPKCDQNTINIANLQQEIDEITPIVIEGDVTNAPDEEDITTDANDLLKLKDRPTAVNQKGYKILRKGTSLASQMTAQNTIYEVRYNFNLDGGTLNVPSGCTLKFNGGKIFNGTLDGNGTSINNEYNIFGIDLTLTGSWNVPYIEPKWFGAVGYGNVFGDGEATPIKSGVTLIDSTVAVKKAIEATFTTTVNHLHFDKLYMISDELEFNVYTLIGGNRYSVTGEGNLSGIISTINDATKYIMAFDKAVNKNVFYYTIENFSIYNVGNSAKGGLRTTNTIRTSVSDITVFGCNHSFAEGCFSFYVVGNLNSFANTYFRLKGICTSSGHGIYLNCNGAYYGWTLTDIRCCCFQAMYGGFGIFEEPVDTSIVPGGTSIAHSFGGIVEHNELEGNLYGAMFFSVTSAIFRKNYGELGTTRYNPYNEDEEHGLQQAPYYIGIMHNGSSGLWTQQCEKVIFENNTWSGKTNTNYLIGFPNVFSTFSQQINRCSFLNNFGSFNYLTRFDNHQFIVNNCVKGSVLPLVLRCGSNNSFKGYGEGTTEMKSLNRVSTFIRNKVVFSFRDSDSYFVYNKGVCPFLYAGDLVSYYSITEGERFLSHGIWFKAVKGGKIHRYVEASFVNGSNIVVANYNNSQFVIGDHINSPFITGGEGYITAKEGNNVTISADAEGTTPCNAIATVNDWLYDALILPDVNQAPIYGSTSSRPKFKTYRIYEGFQYFDTTINKQIYWNGVNWIDQCGELADIARSGTFAQKPTPTNVGFQYFCTSGASLDGGTTETTNLVIYYTGSGWVDANGNAVVAKA